MGNGYRAEFSQNDSVGIWRLIASPGPPTIANALMQAKQPTLPKCEICILAGGLSSRMGRDKAKLRLGRLSMLGHVRKAADELGFRVRVIRRDMVPRCGPMGGILTGLTLARTETVLFLSCDMPFVTSRLLNDLIGIMRSGPASRGKKWKPPAGAFTRSRRGMGFPLVIRREFRGRVEEMISNDDLSLQSLARRLRAKALKVSRARRLELANINTPEELEVFRSQVQLMTHQQG